MKKLIFCFLALLTVNSFGAAAGYIFEGKTYYLFKEGVKINEAPDLGRSIASKSTNSMILYFTEDDIARCYYWAPKGHHKKKKLKKYQKNIHCVKKSELETK